MTKGQVTGAATNLDHIWIQLRSTLHSVGIDKDLRFYKAMRLDSILTILEDPH